MTLCCEPAPGEVHVRLFTLDKKGAELERLAGFLREDELRRADRLRDRRIRDRFVAGRGVLRELLAGYLGTDPNAISFATAEHGKPYLTQPSRLRFNLSHSAGQGVLAITVDREVGIDVEEIRHDLPFREMARRFFSPREQTDLLSLTHDAQRPAFFRCWTRKEAYIKACGSGFTQPSDGFDVSILPDQAPALTGHRSRPEEVLRWKLADVQMPHGYCAALAIEGAMPYIRYFTPKAIADHAQINALTKDIIS